MKKAEFVLKGLINAAGVVLYTAAVAWFLFNGERFSGKADNFLMPMFALLLLIVSVTITGLLVLGKPIQLYLGGLKKEAVALLFATLAWLVLFSVLVMAAILKM